jgi:protein-S-isoprenylcysteine O-methyltransferase Ste14
MMSKGVDVPSLFMVLTFTSNMVIGLWLTTDIFMLERIGEALLTLGALLFIYVLAYLRRGFLGNTEPNLDHLVTEGPYRLCRHPLYLSFIFLVLGVDLMMRSLVGVAFTLLLSVPSAVYRGRVEDRFLREKFGHEWEVYAREVGFFFPRLTRPD